MALAAYATDNDIHQLTASQLEIARKMILALEPVEKNNPGYLKRNCYAFYDNSICPGSVENMGERGR